MARNGGFEVYFEHLYTSVNGMASRGAIPTSRDSTPARRDRAAEIVAESVTFCDIV
jgi:hypothetical protein